MKKLFLISILSICYSINYSQQTGSFEDPRDGNDYKTIKIGTQTWFAENLAYKTDSGCWAYDSNQSNIAKYGYLYNWVTAKQACPNGWHLPSKIELETLLNSVGGNGSIAYQALIQSGGSGFSARLGGYRVTVGGFDSIEEEAYFWSSSSDDDADAWHMYIGIYNKGADVYNLFYENCGFSVRCLKDN